MKKYYYLIVLSTITVLLGCNKDDSNGNDNTNGIVSDTIFGDELSTEDNLFLESISVDNPKLSEMLGVNGNPLAKKSKKATLKATLIDNLLIQAQMLSGEKIIKHLSEGEFSPEHFGIAYSKGQRDFTKRLPPPASDTEANPLHKQYSVFGTDCSGLMINLLRSQGIYINNTDVEHFEKKLNKILKNNPTHKNIVIINEGHLPFDKIESGDFIYWLIPGRNHIGIIATLDNGNKTVFQSNGTGHPKDLADQKSNIGLGRGVHPIDLYKAVHSRNYWDDSYKILRLRDTLQYNLTNDVTKSWKVNPLGKTTYCGNSTSNPMVAMDDVYIFNVKGTFLHQGGAVTVDPNSGCSDGADYKNPWIFNSEQTALILGGANYSIVKLTKTRIILESSDGKLDLIPN